MVHPGLSRHAPDLALWFLAAFHLRTDELDNVTEFHGVSCRGAVSLTEGLHAGNDLLGQIKLVARKEQEDLPAPVENVVARYAGIFQLVTVKRSKFIEDAQEVEIDAVSDGENVYIGSIIEHVEKAGVHSGDAIMTIPPQRLTTQIQDVLVDYAVKIAKSLRIRGPFNTQYIVKDGRVFVIECNLRASRSMPFEVSLMKFSIT
jgi:biotin carboxylase